MKILSVDDSRTIRLIAQQAVDVLGFEFLEAENGQEALFLMSQHGQDVGLILLDWNMPVMDGISTLKAIRSDGRYQHIPVLMVTTEGERLKIIEAIQAGATSYLMKPFSQEDLLTKMLDCLGHGVDSMVDS